jgi:glutamyl/glutaminyl-tRNA synthetase
VSHVTRIAPSPTGLLHLGTARTALFNWLVARSTGGRFILRIDDTDAARNVPEAIQVIDEALAWLGLDQDLRVRQSDRLELYRFVADHLVKTGQAFRDEGAVRLRLADLPDAWNDTVIGLTPITDAIRKQIDGMVLMKSDGYPTYHFASVFDDIDFRVSWVIRGVDHVSNTPKHIAIWRALASVKPMPEPLWSHIGLLTEDGKKISKRDGAASLLSYRDQGIDPDAMFNWLLRMGWGPSVDDKSTTTISRDRALELFLNGGGMRPSPSNIDRKKLDSLDRRYKKQKAKS